MPTLTDRDALMAAILAEPGEDLHRLAYADWLEEAGDLERAEFIRCQVAVAKWCRWTRPDGSSGYTRPPRSLEPPGYRQAAEMERELLLRHWLEWTPRLSAAKSYEVILSEKWTYADTPAVLFRRGFVAEATCSLADWLEHGPALAAAHPLERVTLADREPSRAYGQRCWFYSPQGGHGQCSDLLPKRLWDLLPGPGHVDFGGMRVYEVKGYDSEAAALDSLSIACILWARSRGVRRA